MISKKLKNAYYVEIINTATNLLKEYSKIESKTIKDSPQHEFSNIKKEISSLYRIYNNALIILLKSGIKFSTGTDGWNGSSKVIICINGENHEITMQNVKTILGGGYEKTLDKCFSVISYNNFVDFSIDKSEIEQSYSKLFETFTPSLVSSDLMKKNHLQPMKPANEKKQDDEINFSESSLSASQKPVSIDNKKNKVVEKPVSKPEVKKKPFVISEEPKSTGKPATIKAKESDTSKNEVPKKNPDSRKPKDKKVPSTSVKKPNKGNDNLNKKPAQPQAQKVKKIPIFDDIDEFFDEIGEDINIIPKKCENRPKQIEQKPHLINKPVLSIRNEAVNSETNKPEEAPIRETASQENKKRTTSSFEEDTEEDIWQIDDEENVSTTIPKEVADIFTEPKDLLMDVYKIKKVDPETSESKEFTILVAPLNSPVNDEFKSPIFAFGRTGRISSTACSTTADKPLLQLIIDGEAFVIRGSWSENNFVSLVYPQNVDNQNISVINIKKMRPEENMFIGHNIFHVENLKFHILPLASSNNKNDFASFIACIENSESKKYEMAELIRGNNVLYKYSDKEYRIFARWNDKKLIHKLL